MMHGQKNIKITIYPSPMVSPPCRGGGACEFQ